MHLLQRPMHQSKSIDYYDNDGDLFMPCVISTKHKSTNICQLPKFDACILGKIERVPASTIQFSGFQSGKLCHDDLLSGDGTSMDQFSC